MLNAAGRQPILTFEPSSGTVPARGQLTLAVTFAPTTTTTSNYNVVCLVKKKPSKLTLNVKGEGYAVHDSLHMESVDGHLVELSPDTPNNLDFGQVGSFPGLLQVNLIILLCVLSGMRFQKHLRPLRTDNSFISSRQKLPGTNVAVTVSRSQGHEIC